MKTINEEWISDKTRFIWDGLKTQRLDRPYVRKDGRLQPATWGEAFAAIKAAVAATTGDKIGAIAGDLASVEEMYALARTDEVARLGESRLPPGWRGARSVARPCKLPLQPDDRRASKRPTRC